MIRDEDISVVLVDQDDNVVGYGDKLDVHRKGLLHRSFSVFIFNEKRELLIQRRSKSKYHASLKWVNTCCGHPFPGENVEDAAMRRTKEELGLSIKVNPLMHIYYKKNLDQGMIEHEYAHIFTSEYDGQPLTPDPREVSEYLWMSPSSIQLDLKRDPDKYAAWFAYYIQNHYEALFAHLPA